MPSPNNSFATSYLNNNINLYSGTPNVVIPLFNLPSKELSISVALTYKATGVKLQDYASFVGLNWALNAGGMLTRTVRGLPDESPNGYIGANQTGIQVNNGPESNQVRAEKIANGEYDGEPDIFYISTPTENVSFVFDQYGNAVFNSPTRMSVTFDRTNGPSDNLSIVFYVTDDKGIKYTFGASASDRETVSGTPDFISTWYLSRMNSLNMTDQISFTYVTGPDIVTKSHNRVRTRFFTSGSCSGPAEYISVSDNSRTYKAPKYISTISTAKGTVRFTYLQVRKDLAGAYLLHRVEMSGRLDNVPVRKYQFNYNYFHAVNSNSDLNRLCLKEIYALSGSENESVRLYRFGYYVDPLKPFPARNSVAFDHHGFYNNNSESTPFFPEANKNPDFDKTRQYSLQFVEHAQGGKTEYIYELNTYYDAVATMDRVSGGLRIKQVKEYDNTGNIYTKSFEYKLENGFSSGEVMLKDPQYSRRATLFMPGPQACAITAETTNAGILYNVSELNGSHTGYSRVKVINSDGGYEISTFKNYSDFPEVFTIYNSVDGSIRDINTMRQFGFGTSYSYKRGLIESKSVFSSSDQPVSEIVYSYSTLIPEQKKARGVSLSLSYRLSGSTFANYYENIYYQSEECYRINRETERLFDLDDPNIYVTKSRDYEYNASGTLIRKITYNSSEGASYAQKLYYPENKNELAGLTASEDQAYTFMSRLSLPIRQEKIVNNNIIQTQYTMYNAYTNGSTTKVFPTKKQGGRTGNVLVDEESYVFDLDRGNLITTIGRDGQTNGYLWDRHDNVIVKSEKAAGNEIYHESFEELSNAVISQSFTGKKSFNGSFTIPFVRPNSKNYVVTYRRFINDKWELVTGSYTSDHFTITEPYLIDDVKVYPSGAVLNTYTHQPLVGITSFSDANGHIQHYEYDGLQRLKLIRDENRNIIQQIEQQFACQCPLPVPRAHIEMRNESLQDDGLNTYYSGDLVLVLTYDNSIPANGNNLVVNYSITETTEYGTSVTNNQVSLVGNEVLLFSGVITEYHYSDGSGQPVSFRERAFNVLPGANYAL